jgi:hypothetical protein
MLVPERKRHQMKKPIEKFMHQNGWRSVGGDRWERIGLTSASIAVLRSDGSLSVFVSRKDGGGSLAIPASRNVRKMADEATDFTRPPKGENNG